jgi:hypothetical protein
MHHPHFSVLRPSNWMNPNFRTHGIILEPSAMGTLAGKQEPNEKKFPVHAPSMHGGWCICGCCLTLAILFYLLYKIPHNTHFNLSCWASYMCKQGARHILWMWWMKPSKNWKPRNKTGNVWNNTYPKCSIFGRKLQWIFFYATTCKRKHLVWANNSDRLRSRWSRPS